MNPVAPVTKRRPHAVIVVAGELIQAPAVSPDANTAVVVDTTSYLPDALIERHGIHRVSLYVTLDGEQRRESEIAAAEYDDFYERLRRSEGGATTSQPSVGDFRAVYEPLLAEGRDIVSIHLSTGISGTCDSARQAREQLIEEGKGGERILVYDSRSACGGSGLLAIAAARAAERGTARRPTSWRTSSAPATGSRCGSRSTRSSTCARVDGSAPPRHGWGRRSRSSRS